MRRALPPGTPPVATAAASARTPARILLPVAVGAIYRTVSAWLEGYLGLLAALRAHGRVHLARAAVTTAAAAVAIAAVSRAALAGSLTGRPAARTPAWGRKPFLGEELLLAGREGKFLAAITARKRLVFHIDYTCSYDTASTDK